MASNRTTTNYARLCRLLIGIGTEVLRDAFDGIHPPTILHRVLQNTKGQLEDLRTKGVLSVLQWNKLYPAIAKKVSSKFFDISTLCVLMTNICSLSKPKKGWKNPPHPTDFCPAAEIMRIRELRNSVYAHATEASVDDATFDTYWNDIRNVLVRFGGASYEKDIATLETESMDPENEEHYIGLLEQWKKDEENIKEKLNTIEALVKNSNEKLCEIANKFAGRGLLLISIDINDVALRNTPNDDRLEQEQRRKQLMSAMCRKFFEENADELPSESIPDCLKCYLWGALNVEVKDESEGSLKIIVLCRTLEILERLWEDYSSGHLNEVAEKCLLTDDIKRRYDVEYLTLKTTILEADYLACQHSLNSQEIPCSTRDEESVLQIKVQGAQKTDIQAASGTTDSETAVTALGASCELGDYREHKEASNQPMLGGNEEMKCKELLPSDAVNFLASGSPQYGQHHPKLFLFSTPREEQDGRIRIAVKCHDLKSLESLWERYRSGHLNNVVKYLLTDDIKETFGVESLNVKTTILEDAYQACKEYISAPSVEKKSNRSLVCKLSATSGMASQLVTSTFWHKTFDDIFKDFSPDEWTLEPTDQGMPKEWRQYKDSAKVKFICEDCGRSWTSMNGRVIFWYKKIDKKDDKKELKTDEGKCTSDEGKNDEPKKADKYSLRFRLYGQQCNVCTDGTPDGKFTNPMWYEDETRRILDNVHNRIKQAIYNIQPKDRNDRRRPGRMRMSHDRRRCQACYEGQCSSK